MTPGRLRATFAAWLHGAGLLELDRSAQPGANLRKHLGLDDWVLEINLTPNRGDCFSVLGIAREVAAGQGEGPLDAAVTGIKAGTARVFPVRLDDGAACPRFARRVVSGLSVTASRPAAMPGRPN